MLDEFCLNEKERRKGYIKQMKFLCVYTITLAKELRHRRKNWTKEEKRKRKK